MRRVVTAFVLIAWLIPIPAAKGHSEQAPHSNNAQSGKAKETEPAPPSVVFEKTGSRQQSKQNTDPEKSDNANNSHKWLEWVNATSTSAIAVFAILTTIAIFLQIKTARKSERAWISVKVRHDVSTSKRASAFVDDWVVYLECIITNCGKTPARLTRFRFRYESAEEKAAFSEPPDYGDAGKVMDKMLLAPNDPNPERIHIDSKTLHFFDTKPGWLHVYGIVNYLDAFNAERYTRFCYSCYVPFDKTCPDDVPSKLTFTRSGPALYNKAT